MKRILLFSLLLMFVAASALAQRTVSGKVTSADDGSGIPGVNVILQGTTTGTTTDLDGNYRLSVPEDGGTLVFSFIGLLSQNVAIGARSVIDVNMESDVQQLSEVVVTAIGIESDKKALGYSVQNVASEELVNSRETNLVNALNAKVAGVNVYQSSGSPGSSASIRIRGNTSVSLNNNPLFVVDGIPIDNSEVGNGVDGVDESNRAIDLNPNDIESLTVLKGPAATVLYGIRAANGAIIITTKKGKTGAPKITFGSTLTFARVNQLPEQQDKYAQGRPVDGVPTWRGPETGEGFSWGPAISDLEFDGDESYPYDRAGRLVPAGTGNGKKAQSYNNAERFFQTGVTQDYNVSVSGGTDVMNYYFSTGVLQQKGIVPTADFSRKTFLAKFSANLTDALTFSAQANYINSGGRRIQRGSNVSGVMLGLMRNTPTFETGNGYWGIDAIRNKETYQLPNGTQRSYRAGIYDSPIWTAAKNPYNDDVNRVIGNMSLAYTATPWLTFNYKIGIDTWSDRRLFGTDINSANLPTGQVNQWNLTNTDINSDFLVFVDYDITSEIGLNLTLGHNYYSTTYHGRSAQGDAFSLPGFFHMSNASTQTAAEAINEKEIMGIYGSARVGYRDFVFVDLSARNDWSSALPDKNNSFLYSSASLSFVFSELLGASNTGLFNFGKLRASWGQVGNDAPIYSTANYFGGAFVGGDGFITGIQFPAALGSGSINAFERNAGLGNGELEAEITTTIEIGLEARFLQGRLGFDATYYTSETDGQVINVGVAPSTGFSSTLLNAGVIENSGIEISATGTPVKMGDFTWDISANFTKYRSFIKELHETVGPAGIGLSGFVSTSSRAIPGRPYGVIYGDAYQTVSGSGGRRGELIIGSDGWPLTSPDKKVLGNPNPDFLLNVRNSFSWKGVSLSALLDIRQGGDMWNGTRGVMNYFGMGKSTEKRNVQGYVFDGVVNTGTADAPVYEKNTTPVDFYEPSGGPTATKWGRYGFGFSNNEVMDASWIRLREVTMGYSLPKSMLSNTFVESLNVSVTGRNLLLLTEYDGIDPEANLTGNTNGFGLEYFGMPATKSFSVNLQATF